MCIRDSAVPSVFVRSTAAKARPYVADGQIIVDVAKGIEPDTLYTCLLYTSRCV